MEPVFADVAFYHELLRVIWLLANTIHNAVVIGHNGRIAHVQCVASTFYRNAARAYNLFNYYAVYLVKRVAHTVLNVGLQKAKQEARI